jgi:hypothetical protein
MGVPLYSTENNKKYWGLEDNVWFKEICKIIKERNLKGSKL